MVIFSFVKKKNEDKLNSLKNLGNNNKCLFQRTPYIFLGQCVLMLHHLQIIKSLFSSVMMPSKLLSDRWKFHALPERKTVTKPSSVPS